MRVLVAQRNPTVGDLEGNCKKIIQSIQRAREKNADIVVFPELALCGYPPEDLLLHPSFIEAQERYLEEIAEASQGVFVVVGLVRRNPFEGEKPLFNSVAIIQDKKLLGFEDKQLLPTYDVFDERRYFEPGSRSNVWEYKGKKIAVLICEDIWQHAGYEYIEYTHYLRDPVKELKALNIDLLLNPSSSPYQFQKLNMRIKVCMRSCATLKCPLIICCQVGGNDELVFDGYSLYMDAKGSVRQLAKGFEEEEMLVDLTREGAPLTIIQDDLRDLYSALVLGVRDYMHKSGFKTGCLGLSGGIDSALVACIAVDALGKENVVALSMPSRYSSPSSITDAEHLAHNLQIPLQHIPIESLFQESLNCLQPFFQEKPSDITEENLQARLRGLILMAFSNKLGYILLSTGNKSEMAMGYCTLYGDMAGGLSVISDVTKQQVYALARWINRQQEIIPHTIIEKEPSAELKAHQKDTDALPTYDIVDNVLRSYVEEFRSPQEIAHTYHLPLDLVLDLVHRIHRAEYKRRQSAPGIRVSKKAFRIGRRYPIVQGWM